MSEALPLPLGQRPNKFTDNIGIYQYYKKTSTQQNEEYILKNETYVNLPHVYNFITTNNANTVMQSDGSFLIKKNVNVLYDINLVISTSESCILSINLVNFNDEPYTNLDDHGIHTVITSSIADSKNITLKSLISHTAHDTVKLMLKSYTNVDNNNNIVSLSASTIVIM